MVPKSALCPKAFLLVLSAKLVFPNLWHAYNASALLILCGVIATCVGEKKSDVVQERAQPGAELK